MPETGGGAIDISICWRREIEPFEWLWIILDEQELDDSDDIPHAGDMVGGFILGADTGVGFNVVVTCVLVGNGEEENSIFAWEATNSLCKKFTKAGL